MRKTHPLFPAVIGLAVDGGSQYRYLGAKQNSKVGSLDQGL